MATYRYKGISPGGEHVKGVIKAPNEYEAVALLREQCAVVSSLDEVLRDQDH